MRGTDSNSDSNSFKSGRIPFLFSFYIGYNNF